MQTSNLRYGCLTFFVLLFFSKILQVWGVVICSGFFFPEHVLHVINNSYSVEGRVKKKKKKLLKALLDIKK